LCILEVFVKRIALLLACLLLPLTALAEIKFLDGPLADIGGLAQVKVPKGWKFVPAESCKEFMDQTGNLASGQERGVLIDATHKDGMWIFFEWDEVGYVKDAEKEKLDAAKMWEQMLEGTKQRGWEPMELVRWEKQPEYNPKTQRLEWALRLRAKGKEFVNFHTRVLGRKGVMKVVLAMENKDQAGQLARFNQVLDGYSFKAGNRYAEWTTGEKVAVGGLSALVVGGAAALAAKTGLLAKLWKVILVALVALASFFKRIWERIKRFWARLTGHGDDPKPPFGGDQLKGKGGQGPIVP
jgi:uncharacterized membrane-anchored protein